MEALNTPSDRQIKRFAKARDEAFISLDEEIVDFVPCMDGTALHGSQFKSLPLTPCKSFYPRQTPEAPDPLSIITKNYILWLKDDRYILFQNNETGKYILLPAAKRGNLVYANRVKHRFDSLKFSLPNQTFFNPDYSERCARSTPLILTTLTYDPSRYTIGEAWDNLPADYNRCMAMLRKSFPGVKIGTLRGNEAHKSGYPHMHVLIAFDTPLPVVRHNNRSGKTTWRLTYDLKEKIARCWNPGYVDILAMPTTSSAIDYVSKYIVKGLTVPLDSLEYPDFDNKVLVALAVQWAKGMRAFSFSKLFISNLGGRLDKILHNSNSDYTYIGTFPPCVKKCIEQRGKIHPQCPFLRHCEYDKPPPT